MFYGIGLKCLVMLTNFLSFQVPLHLTTTYYKLLPSHASDLFIDLAYFHLELSAIAVKGILPHLLEMSVDNAEKLALMERGSKDQNNAALDTVLRLVICQGNMLSVKCKFTIAETFVCMRMKLNV